ncbi:hypothetical protein [Streptomyces erythrochromogenes]|uniref:hypothetical protein n=1 Tax=Streptomyces erythrochromogenes TaxID=285574 RepID=UPI0036F8354A
MDSVARALQTPLPIVLPGDHMHRAALGTATAALAAVLALTSCSDSSTGGADTASQPSPEASAGATGPGGATATPAQPADFAGTAHVTDADNYTFDITYSYRTTGVQRDTANDKPGFSSALIKTNAELTVTNTTSGRTLSFKPVSGIVAPFGDPQLQVLAYFNPGRAVCSLETVNSFLATKEKGQAGCTVQLNFARPSTTLTAGGTDTPEVFRGLQNGQGTAGVAAVPDAQWAAVEAELRAPDNFLIAYVGADTDRFKSYVCSEKMSKLTPFVVSAKPGCVNLNPSSVRQPKTS